MKNVFVLLITIIILTGGAAYAQQQTHDKDWIEHQLKTGGEEDRNEAQAQAQFEMRKLVDPATGKIPSRMRQKELMFTAHIPTRESAIALAKGTAQVQSTNWVARGPYNVGGRTRAIGIDVSDTSVLLAGGVSGGGIWRSTNGGTSWVPTQTDNAIQGATCLAQDTRAGKTNTWYYGTGEELGSQGRPALFLTGFTGNGIYKSTDDGQTWQSLPATVSNDAIDVVQPFDFVSNIVTDPSNASQDIVYAAVLGGIERSTDGGATWNMVLGSYPGGSFFSDVAITTTGVLYAALSTHTAFDTTDPVAAVSGIFRSTDGTHWTNITPTEWPSGTGGMSIAIAPSNEKAVYFLSTTQLDPFANQDGAAAHAFWKYKYVSGDGSGSGGQWDNRSANLPDGISGPVTQYPFETQYSYDMYVRVASDNEDDIYFGGVYLYNSTDGLATNSAIQVLNNITTSLFGPGTLHPDEHALVFYPGNPNKLLAGSDGGLFRIDLNNGLTWTPVNNGYFTTQFYTVALDHGTPGNEIVIGGMQDNGTSFSGAAVSSYQWPSIFGGDGSYCAIADDRTEYYVSSQSGSIYRYNLDDQGMVVSDSFIFVTPLSGSGFQFIAPFLLDPNDQSRMYLASANAIYRNNDLTQIQNQFGLNLAVDWDELMNTNVPGDTISTISLSTSPSDVMYYGTMHGKVLRIDNASSGDPVPKDVSQAKGFPAGGYVSCVAIDPQNANNAMVVFANYHVQSLYYTTDGGTTWTPEGGNLEEQSDGSGNGPSCRWASILHVQGGIVYLVGTSTGLYSSSHLNGNSTIWYKEGGSTIGNAIVDMMDVRQSDGMVAVASHGSGMYSGAITSPDAVNEGEQTPDEFTLRQNMPNPFGLSTSIQYSLQQPAPVTLNVYDQLGRMVETLVSGVQSSGEHTAEFNPAPGLPDGVYYYRLQSGSSITAKQMMLIK